MKSKRCSHNLQSDQQGSCQRISVLIMRITSKIHRSTVLRRNKNMAVEGGTVSHYYILVISKFIDLMSLFRHSVWFSFSVKQFPSAEFDIFKVDTIQIFLVAKKDISTCRNCSSVGCLKCVQFHNWFRLH